ncbi:MAG: hypothetical protein ACT4QC_01220 [Planctomycetaceae bacterium]
MKNWRWTGVLLVAAVAGAVALLSADAQAQKTKGKTRPAMTRQLMKGVVAPNCGELGKLLKDPEVKWDEVALKAAVLNEMGYVLMDDGRCPDGEWAKAAKAVQSATAAILEAAEAKNLEAANAAFTKLTKDEGCAVCHAAHKPKAQ